MHCTGIFLYYAGIMLYAFQSLLHMWLKMRNSIVEIQLFVTGNDGNEVTASLH